MIINEERGGCVGFFGAVQLLLPTLSTERNNVSHSFSLYPCHRYFLTTTSRPTTSSSVTTSIEANNPSRLYASYSPTRSSIPKISSFCVATMNAPASIGYTAFTTNAVVDFPSSYGRPFVIPSTAFPVRR